MKTLKKTLCLVLAVVMAVGVLVLPASAADYTDADEIENKEAAAVMDSLKVIEGNEGKYMPETKLDRQQAAVIISRLMQTRDVSDDYVGSTVQFNDVDKEKDYGYNEIAYCVSKGIIVGDGMGNFLPDVELTGHAFAKMLLCALGYKADYEGYANVSEWAQNVETEARAQGLNKGLKSFDYSKVLTRDQAAQMAYNAMNVPTVTGYTGGTSIELPGGVVLHQGAERAQKGQTLFSRYELVKLDGKEKDAEGNVTNEMLNNGVDKYGRPASYQIVVDGATSPIYTQPISAAKIYTTETKDPETDFKTGYTYDSNLKAIINGQSDTSQNVIDGAAKISNLTGNGTIVEVYCTGKKIDRVIVIARTVVKVDSISKDEVKVSTIGSTSSTSYTVKKDDADNYAILSAMKKDDYAAVVIGGTSNNTVLAAEALTPVTGIITAVNKTAKTVTIAGTVYTKAATLNLETVGVKATDEQVGLIDANNYVLAVVGPNNETAETADVVLVVSTYTGPADDYGVSPTMFQGVLPDGTIITELVGTVDGKSGSLTKATAYQYVIDPETGAYNFTTANGGDKKVGAIKITGNVALSDKSNKINNNYIASSAKFVYVTGELSQLDVDSRDGVQDVTLASGDYVVISKDTVGNYVVTAVYIVEGKDNEETASDKLMYVPTSTASTGSAIADDGKTPADLYEVYINGEKTTIMVTKDVSVSSGWHTFKVNDTNGIYTVGSAPTSGTVTPSSFELAYVNDVYYLTDKTSETKEYVATDAVVVDVSGASSAISTIGGLYERFKTEKLSGLAVTFSIDKTNVTTIYITSQGTVSTD